MWFFIRRQKFFISRHPYTGPRARLDVNQIRMNATAVPAHRHIRAAALAHYFEVAEAAGLNPQPLLRRAGLSRRMLVDPEQRIPLAAALQLLEESAEASGLADFGLRMAQARRLSDLGALSLLLTHLSSLRAVLQTLIHSRQLVGGTLALAMVETGKSTAIREELVGPAGGPFAPGDRARAGRPVPPVRHLARPALEPSERQLPPCRPGRHPSAPATLQLQIEIWQRVQRHRLRDGRPRQPEPAGRPGACRLRAAPGRRARRGGGGHPRANRAQGPVCATSARPDVDRAGGTGPGPARSDAAAPVVLRTESHFQSWSTRSGATWCCAIWPSPATA